MLLLRQAKAPSLFNSRVGSRLSQFWRPSHCRSYWTSSQGTTVTIQKDKTHSLVTVKPPSTPSRPIESDICCVIDVSGSMAEEAQIKVAAGDSVRSESYGITVLDIVTHAARTIVNSLTENDRLSLVSFNDRAQVLLPLTKMDENGKQQALAIIHRMVAYGSTNLWDGLKTGLDQFHALSDDLRNPSLFILTDGQPNVDPPRGHLPTLQRYQEDKASICQINTFGFGTGLDSKLLFDLALQGAGSYSFIPDASFVGTIFINALSNNLTTMATNVKMTVETQGKVSMSNDWRSKNASWGKEWNVGPLHYGKTHSFLLKTIGDVNVAINFSQSGSPSRQLTAQKVDVNPHEMQVHKFRYQFYEVLSKILDAHGSTLLPEESVAAQQTVKAFIDEVKASAVAQDLFIVDLLKDISGEVLVALDKQHYRKWGYHYLLSLIGAHMSQECNNFKDPGVQHYASPAFNEQRDRIDAVFMSLPPPQPTKNVGAFAWESFNSSSNPCFEGTCDVLVIGADIMKVKDLRRGDKVVTHEGIATVRCVLKTRLVGPTQLVTLPEGLKITPWHPVRIEGQWKFPHDLAVPAARNGHAVYSFLLDQGHTMIINGICCATLGHQFSEPVVSHPYWGTNLVVEDLQRHEGWDEGFIEIQQHVGNSKPSSPILEKVQFFQNERQREK